MNDNIQEYTELRKLLCICFMNSTVCSCDLQHQFSSQVCVPEGCCASGKSFFLVCGKSEKTMWLQCWEGGERGQCCRASGWREVIKTRITCTSVSPHGVTVGRKGKTFVPDDKYSKFRTDHNLKTKVIVGSSLIPVVVRCLPEL